MVITLGFLLLIKYFPPFFLHIEENSVGCLMFIVCKTSLLILLATISQSNYMVILISMQRHFNYGKREMNMHVENLILSSIAHRCRFVEPTML